MPRPIIDLMNQSFGRLTVIRQGGSGRHGNRLWICQCECGNQASIPGSSLTHGLTRSCGCLRSDAAKNRKKKEPEPKITCEAVTFVHRRGPQNDLTGQTFGRWTVAKLHESAGPYSMWWCVCSCGKRKSVRGSNLTAGLSLSCGCLKKERAREATFRDLTGEKFGLAQVIRRIERRKEDTLWLCRCECGNTFSAYGAYLKDKRHPASCGCNYAAMSRLNGRLANSKHGYGVNRDRPREYISWGKARARAREYNRPIAPEFDDFETFLQAVGPKPSADHNLVLIEKAKGLVPGNVEWRHAPKKAGEKPLPDTPEPVQQAPAATRAVPWARSA